MSSRTDRVFALLKSIETGDTSAVAVINPQHYRQHNLAVEDGLEGFGKLIAMLPQGAAKVRTVRAFEDGNFVFTHTEYDFFGPKIGFDIFRFDDERIVEHWDNLQEMAGPNPSGHSMIDGPTTASLGVDAGTNKDFVRRFVDEVLVNGKLDKLSSYFDGDRYVQHNPQIGNGVTGLAAALDAMAKAGITMRYDRVHQVLGEGDFVLVVSEGSFAGEATSFYDLFRVENGTIAEHWDTMETIPARAEWKNGNGKFDF